jgi:hypothetical protein
MRRMRRSAGVTVIAVLSILGSLFFLLVACVMALGIVLGGSKLPAGTDPQTAQFAKFGMVFGIVFMTAPAIWGLTSGIGLLRLRNWARLSSLIFSGIIAFMGLMSPIFVLSLPMAPPPNADASIMRIVKIVMAVSYLSLAALGVWWMIYLTRPRIKAQFQSALPAAQPGATLAQPGFTLPARSGRPLSISIIGWLMIVGTCFVPINFALHLPMVFFNRILMGSVANLALALFGTVGLVTGVGLLRLRPFARLVAIGYLLLGTLNGITFWLMPGSSERMARIFDAMPTFLPTRPPVPTLNPWVMGVMVVPVMLVQVYFLVKHKPAFHDTVPLPPPPAMVTEIGK